MKRKLLFIALLALMTSTTLHAYDALIDGIYYNFSGDKAIVTYETQSSRSYSGDVVIPESVTYNGKTYSVTSIGSYAFYYCTSLTSVTIPNSVTSIGDRAFFGCSSLTSVTIPNSVTSIGNDAFSGCYGLTSVHITDLAAWCNIAFQSYSFPSYSNPLSYAHHLYMNGEEIKDLVIPNSVTSIGEAAFSGCSSLTSVTIPNSVTSIGSYAFGSCSGLTSVTIPNSVTSIGEAAFSGCSSLTSIVVKSGNTKYDSRDNCNAIIEMASNTLIAGCKNTTIPNSVTSIGDYAFYQCRGLTSVTIGNSVTSIGDWAFSGCSGLTSVTIPNSVTSIDDRAFYGCSDLTSVTIPNSVTSIGEAAFRACYGLTSITIGNGVTSIGKDAFGFCSSLTSVTIPNSVTSIGSSAFESCTGLTSVTIPNSVTSIGEEAFHYCSGLTSITIPNSVTSIDDCVFYGCSSLTSITIPNSVTSIGDDAFYGCSSLTSITIPNSVTSIGDFAFWNCSGLTSVTIPESVTSIGSCTFQSCSGLTSVTIPNSVTSIHMYAFGYCRDLTDFYCYADSVPNTYVGAFRDSPIASATLHVPGCSIEAYRTTEPWSGFGRIVALPTIIDFADANVKALCVANWDTNGDGELDIAEAAVVTDLGEVFTNNTRITSFDELRYFTGLTSIGSNAFKSCSSLTSITIPNSVTSIVTTVSEHAFYQCKGLSSIKVDSGNTTYDSRDNCNAIIETASNTLIVGCQNTVIPNTVTKIGSFAFSSCSGLTAITIPSSVTNIDGWAFEFCENLISIAIPESVTSIGFGAFQWCRNMVSVSIPNSVTKINWYTFWYCTNLNFIVSKITDPFSFHTSTFSDIGNECVLIVPKGTRDAYIAAGWTEEVFKGGIIEDGLEVTISSAGFATFYDKYGDVIIPEGVTAYTATVRNGSVVLTEIKDGKIPVKTPVVLKSVTDTYEFSYTTGAEAVGDNHLRVSTGSLTANGTQYALTKKSGVVGFNKIKVGTAIPEGKVYLQAPSAGIKEFFAFEEDDATDIQNLNDNANLNETIYNLAGQRINKMQRGINIVNGKKILF